MREIHISIKETPRHQRETMEYVSGAKVGKYMALVELSYPRGKDDKCIKLFSKEDSDVRPEDLHTTIYAQTQMLQLHDQIKFCLLAIADGRVK